MKNLVMYCTDNGELISISEGDGSNLSSEDEANGFVDYICYDVYDIQNIGEPVDGGMILLKKPIIDEFKDSHDVLVRVLNMHRGWVGPGTSLWLDGHVKLLSGRDDWAKATHSLGSLRMEAEDE